MYNIFKCLYRVLEQLAEFHASEKKPITSGEMSNPPFPSLHDMMSNHFVGEESFTNGNLLYLSVICLPL